MLARVRTLLEQCRRLGESARSNTNAVLTGTNLADNSPLEFYFEFSSPYGYFASTQIDALGAKYGRSVIWRPFLLGAVFRHNGEKPLLEIPLKVRLGSR
jgi:hypothetical protein